MFVLVFVRIFVMLKFMFLFEVVVKVSFLERFILSIYIIKNGLILKVKNYILIFFLMNRGFVSLKCFLR